MAAANQPLLTIMNNTHLIAKAHVSQSQAAGLKKGDSAEIVIAGEEEPIPAKLSLVSPALDPGSTTIEIWVEAAKPPASLRPGMTVQVSITAATAKDAVVVPNNAIFQSTEGGGNYLMVAGTDNVAHQKSVQLGLRGVNETQIKSGVTAGESIITTGGYGLPDKTKIKIEAPAKDEDADKTGEKSGEKPDDKSDEKAGAAAGKKSADKSAKKPAASEKE
jgi:RND family efflux transporter MFP subunit